MQDLAKVSLRIWGQSQEVTSGSLCQSSPWKQPHMEEKLESLVGTGGAGRDVGPLSSGPTPSRAPAPLPQPPAGVPGSAEINSLKEQNLVGGGVGPWEHPGAAKEQASGSICSVRGSGSGTVYTAV